MRSELEPVIYSYRVYGDDPDSYIGVCQIHRYGDVGVLTAMHGSSVLKSLARDVTTGNLAGITSLEGFVLTSVAQATRVVAQSVGWVCTFTRSYKDGDREFQWIKVAQK